MFEIPFLFRRGLSPLTHFVVLFFFCSISMQGLSWEKNLSSLVQEIQEESLPSKEGGRRRKRELYGRLGQEEKAAAGGFEAGGGENRRQEWVGRRGGLGEEWEGRSLG